MSDKLLPTLHGPSLRPSPSNQSTDRPVFYRCCVASCTRFRTMTNSTSIDNSVSGSNRTKAAASTLSRATSKRRRVGDGVSSPCYDRPSSSSDVVLLELNDENRVGAGLLMRLSASLSSPGDRPGSDPGRKRKAGHGIEPPQQQQQHKTGAKDKAVVADENRSNPPPAGRKRNNVIETQFAATVSDDEDGDGCDESNSSNSTVCFRRRQTVPAACTGVTLAHRRYGTTRASAAIPNGQKIDACTDATVPQLPFVGMPLAPPPRLPRWDECVRILNRRR